MLQIRGGCDRQAVGIRPFFDKKVRRMAIHSTLFYNSNCVAESKSKTPSTNNPTVHGDTAGNSLPLPTSLPPLKVAFSLQTDELPDIVGFRKNHLSVAISPSPLPLGKGGCTNPIRSPSIACRLGLRSTRRRDRIGMGATSTLKKGVSGLSGELTFRVQVDVTLSCVYENDATCSRRRTDIGFMNQ